MPACKVRLAAVTQLVHSQCPTKGSTGNRAAFLFALMQFAFLPLDLA